LPIKYLSIIRWIIRKIIKFWDLSRGDRQTQEKKKNGEHSTHGSILESMVAPKPSDLNVIACPEKMSKLPTSMTKRRTACSSARMMI